MMVWFVFPLRRVCPRGGGGQEVRPPLSGVENAACDGSVHERTKITAHLTPLSVALGRALNNEGIGEYKSSKVQS